jgi:hypothetical protein
MLPNGTEFTTLKAEREEYLERSYLRTSWNPRIKVAPDGLDFAFYDLHVGHHLLMTEREVELYQSGDVDYFLRTGRPLTALLADQRQMGIVFHHGDMVEYRVNPAEGGKLLTATIFDSNWMNAIQIAGLALKWNPQRERSYEVFKTGFRKPSLETV